MRQYSRLRVFILVVSIIIIFIVFVNFNESPHSARILKQFPLIHIIRKGAEKSENLSGFSSSSSSSEHHSEIQSVGHENKKEKHPLDEENGGEEEVEKYLIKTPGCTIPVTNIWPEFYQNLYFYNRSTKRVKNRKRQWIPDCRADARFATLTDKNRVLKFDHRYKGMNCTVTEVKRMDLHDNNITRTVHMLDETSMELDVSKMELLLSQCGKKFFNFDARIVMKPEVKEKLKFWKEVKEEAKEKEEPPPTPISVLFLGFDSTARSHFYRSLPKSVKVLEDLGFINFRGFHTLSAHTVPNLRAYFYHDTTKDGCCDGYYDNCPFYWKEFHRQNYLTMFNEDGTQSFNFGWQEGFKFKQPTDYYLHPLFVAHKIHRPSSDFDNKDCVSSETVPQFLLRYLDEFYQHFANKPFFTFTYFNDPWHDDVEALSDFDEDLAVFLVNNLTPEFLEKTLIILAGDHGERYGHFHTYSLEAYLERSLPALFIRPPEILQKKHPSWNFREMLEINSRRLVSARDVYQTVVHTILLSETHKYVPREENSTSILDNFQPVLPGRSSLYYPIPENRTCVDLQIDTDGTCICNSASIEDAQDLAGNVSNPFVTQRLVIFATEQLNKRLQESEKWRFKCVEWEFGMLPHLSTQYLRKEETYQDVLLKMELDADREDEQGGDIEGQFQVQIRIHNKELSEEERIRKGIIAISTKEVSDEVAERKNSIQDRFEVIGQFTRIDEYGEQSWCIEMDSEDDKKFKDMCGCSHDKDKPPPPGSE